MFSKIIILTVTLYIVNASVVMVNDYDDTVAAKSDTASDQSRHMMPPRCTDKICGQFCDLVGFNSGACLDGRCKCNHKTETSAGSTDNGDSEKVVKREIKEDTESYLAREEYSILETILAKCNEICDRVCRFLHFESGTCESGRCKCDKKEPSENDEAATNYIEDTNLITEQENNK